MPRVLLVAKTPLLRRFDGASIDRIVARGALDRGRLDNAVRNHDAALIATRAAFTDCDVHEVCVDHLTSQDTAGCAVIVTVGGDGTVLAANAISADLPLITVNSDPGGSLGVFARTDATRIAAFAEAWRRGAVAVESIPRLEVSIDDGAPMRFLNDCLIASCNPAAMTRYVLEVDGQQERQRSSGLWIATAAGSTAGIHSAGSASVSPHQSALLYRVREPFDGHGRLRIREGIQSPPVGLRLIPAMPDVTLFIDGPHRRHALTPGVAVDIRPCSEPLRLLRLPTVL
jgi:NAD+ kinase